MKLIIHYSAEHQQWYKTFFPDLPSPLLLKILNKPLIEYYIDFCVLLGIKSIRIVSDAPEKELKELLSDGTQWGVDISYSLSKSEDTIQDIVNKNKAFIDNDKLLYIKNLIFINYNKNKTDYELLNYDHNTVIHENGNSGLYFLSNLQNKELDEAKKKTCSDISVNSIASITDFFRTSIDTLKNCSNNFVIPGYSSEPSIFIGQNVEITKMTKISKPCAIGNNIRFNDADIGPFAIIGSNTLIDKNTKVENSIIYDNTYIGSALEIKNKIVNHRKLINPENGEILDVSDEFIITNVQSIKALQIFKKIFFTVVTILILVIQLPFYFILLPFVRVVRKEELCLTSKKGKTDKLLFLSKEKNTFLNGLFFKLSLNKFPLLLKAISGKISLTGNTPLLNDEFEILKEMSLYKPGVFNINEMIHNDADDLITQQLNELYYSNNSSFKLDLAIFVKSLISNLLN